MGGPYGPQSIEELLGVLVEEKGFMTTEDINKWVDYVESYIQQHYIPREEVIKAIGNPNNRINKERDAFRLEVLNDLGLEVKGDK